MTPPERKKHEESNNHPFGNALGSRTTLGGIRSGNNSDAVCRMLNRRGYVRRGKLRIDQDLKGGVMEYYTPSDDEHITLEFYSTPEQLGGNLQPHFEPEVDIMEVYYKGEVVEGLTKEIILEGRNWEEEIINKIKYGEAA